MLTKEEKNLADEVAEALNVSRHWAHTMLSNPEKGNNKDRILAVIDSIDISPFEYSRLINKLYSTQKPPRKKGERGRKLYAEIAGEKVEITAASAMQHPFRICERERAGELKYVGKGKLLQPMKWPRCHFVVGNEYHFWK